MRLVRDRTSYEEPLDRARLEAERAVLVSGRPVRGATERAERAIAERDALTAYEDAVAERLETASFAALPRLRTRGWRPYPFLHVLEVAPWRGIFHVDPHARFAIALLFSKAPHRLAGRIDEIVARSLPEAGR